MHFKNNNKLYSDENSYKHIGIKWKELKQIRDKCLMQEAVKDIFVEVIAC